MNHLMMMISSCSRLVDDTTTFAEALACPKYSGLDCLRSWSACRDLRTKFFLPPFLGGHRESQNFRHTRFDDVPFEMRLQFINCKYIRSIPVSNFPNLPILAGVSLPCAVQSSEVPLPSGHSTLSLEGFEL